ncbi:Transmembrane protein 14C [Chionoecetes opilio]|uniref:Transmembrane protein 14C n=1 Tax=Chionoecetes opilio TaxID=41210 RepID=A0A8J4XW93_CHIOP|nr:Transmembrane protein 14C [Chionoecetes opilio]
MGVDVISFGYAAVVTIGGVVGYVKAELPDKSTETELPDKSTETELPDKSTETELPDKSTETELPDKSTETELPDKSTETELPDTSTETEWVKSETESLKRSVPSLAAGLVFGSLLSFGAYQLSNNPNDYYLTLGTSTVLGGIMGLRFINSGKFMPAGLVAGLSLAMIARLGARAAGLTGTKMQ